MLNGVRKMRICYGILVGILWCIVLAMLWAKTGVKFSSEAQIISTAIIIAGAMAGGD